MSFSFLTDKLCDLPDIQNGGVVCSDHGGSEDCRIVCESGYVVNPIRIFRRHFNCKHPDDIDALHKVLSTQVPCLGKYEMIIFFPNAFLFQLWMKVIVIEMTENKGGCKPVINFSILLF